MRQFPDVTHGVPSNVLSREAARRNLVTRRDYLFGGQSIYWYSTEYDLLNRPTNATDSVSLVREWLYNRRSELAAATVGTDSYGYAYDSIGNRLWSSANLATNTYVANSLNQYASVGRGVLDPPQTAVLTYDADGNMTRDGTYSYSYDAENRMRSVTSRTLTNGAIRVLNAYDHRNCRIRKIVQRLHSTSAPPPAPPSGTDEWLTLETHTFVWDGNNIVLEKVEFANGTTRTFEYFWGLDKSGTEQGAGGVEGLLAVSMDGVFYIPCYDNIGNVTRYLDANGNTVAQYTYDAFGNTISKSGPLADFFRHCFSTKYYDAETGLYYYGYRFYHPILMRWLNRDPIGENGGCNVYVICNNNVMQQVDYLGLYLWYVLYYDENKSGSNFKRAAETRKRLIETSSAFNSNCDSVEMYSIRTDNDFFSVWNTLNAHSRKKSKRVTRFQVKGLYLYTHSGPGQLFLRNSTANSLQIKKLPPLNWALQAEIQCLGCNSGVENSSGDSLAGSFYESQQVPTLGQAAASTFSSNPNNKSKWGVVLGFSDVYLWAFDDKGNRIAPIRYPKK